MNYEHVTELYSLTAIVCLYLFDSPPSLTLSVTPLATWNRRCARKAERIALQLLPGALHRHYFRDYNPPTNFVLFLQFNRSLCADRVHGAPRLRTSAGLGRETIARWVWGGQGGGDVTGCEFANLNPSPLQALRFSCRWPCFWIWWPRRCPPHQTRYRF